LTKLLAKCAVKCTLCRLEVHNIHLNEITNTTLPCGQAPVIISIVRFICGW